MQGRLEWVERGGGGETQGFVYQKQPPQKTVGTKFDFSCEGLSVGSEGTGGRSMRKSNKQTLRNCEAVVG